MKEKDEEKEGQPQESAFEVTELDDRDLEDASGGTFDQADRELAATNENCGVC
jgi:hypothetical protein